MEVVAMKQISVAADRLVAPHPAPSERLLESMRNGWIGRPLLARPLGDGLKALTGSHRLASALILGLEVPVLLIEDADLDADGWDAIDAANDDDDLLAALEQHGLIDAAALLKLEPNLGGSIA
jgi:ParB-like chromosome segregation protein Spo0J